jgi:DNA invertase Pin-like site-specific DNA recombinase
MIDHGTSPTIRAIGYARISGGTGQHADGLGMDAQRRSIADTVAMQGWELVDIAEDVVSTRKHVKQHGLIGAMGRIEAGEAQVLVVMKLDRLARSVIEGARIVARAKDHGWRLIICDLGVDTATPAGQLATSMLFACAEFERSMISERTKAALAVAKSNGTKLGRHRGERWVSQATQERIRELRAAGLTLRAIGTQLVAEGHLPVRSDRWSPEQIRRIAA